MARGTTPQPASDVDAAKRFLDEDPVGTAVVRYRGFPEDHAAQVFVDGSPPRAVLACGRPHWNGGQATLGLHATDPAAARRVAEAIPTGPGHIHLTEEWLASVVEERASEFEPRSAWLFALDAKDFVDLQTTEVRPIGEAWAPLIAKTWEPDWPSEEYVRSRLRVGPTAGVFVDGQLVAWGLTHLETDRVSMMGFLHVLDAHRGKGYAKAVGSHLIKDILGRGKIPALHVWVDNVPSLELTPRFGFHRVKKQVWADGVYR